MAGGCRGGGVVALSVLFLALAGALPRAQAGISLFDGEPQPEQAQQRDGPAVMSEAIADHLKAPVEFPGLTGYFGWNYEAATAILAIDTDASLQAGAFPPATHTLVSSLLQRATAFPFPGNNIRRAEWLYAPGDRIALFGALYQPRTGGVAKGAEIVAAVRAGLLAWPQRSGCFARHIGWGPVWGVRPEAEWVWADDTYMGALPLMQTDPAVAAGMVLAHDKILRDPSDHLYWHGARVPRHGDPEPNGVKWGRANAWMLLTVAHWCLQAAASPAMAGLPATAEIRALLATQVGLLAGGFQRPTGAFGNIVNDPASPDETSLTAVFVYAAAVLARTAGPQPEAIAAAARAWEWVASRSVQAKPLAIADTCGAAGLGTDPAHYNQAVGTSAGPAIGLYQWAVLGAAMLKL